MARTTLLYRPEHPLANERGMVSIVHVDPDEAELAVCGEKHVAVVGDSHHDGTRAPDGTDISSRTKRRAYMKKNNLADFDDFKGVREKKQKELDAMRTGHFDNKERKEAIAKAFWQVGEKGYKPKTDTAKVLGREGVAVAVDKTALPDHDKGPVRLSGDM